MAEFFNPHQKMCQGTNWSMFTIYTPLYCNMQGKPKDCFWGVSLGTPKNCFRWVSLGTRLYNLFCLFLSRTLFWLHPFLLAYQCKPTSWFINNSIWQKTLNNIDLDSLANVDIYYEKWVKECAESAKHSDFQKLWEVLMIRVTSEAICETAGSMMNQHCGKNRFLQPENFNIEMYLKFNLGPLHLLDNFVKEILASDSSQSYLRKEQAKKRRLVTNDLNKSAAMETIEKRIEKKSRFPISFWQDTSK